MKQTALVESVDIDGRKAVVKVQRETACSGCKINNSCFGCKKFIEAPAGNNIGAEKGDIVEIETSSSKLLVYAALTFVLPIVSAAVLYFIAGFFTNSEPYSVIFAILGFIVPFIVLMIISKIRGERDLDITITGIIQNGDLNNVND